jgi:hypothetical protein
MRLFLRPHRQGLQGQARLTETVARDERLAPGQRQVLYTNSSFLKRHVDYTQKLVQADRTELACTAGPVQPDGRNPASQSEKSAGSGAVWLTHYAG